MRLIYKQTLVQMYSWFIFNADCYKRYQFLQICKGGLHAVTGKCVEVRKSFGDWSKLATLRSPIRVKCLNLCRCHNKINFEYLYGITHQSEENCY